MEAEKQKKLWSVSLKVFWALTFEAKLTKVKW